MEKVKWWKKAVVYQIYPKSFYDTNGDGIGDLPGIIEKLPYIKTLGVDVIWLSPFYKSPGYDNGYDISDYEDVDSVYGMLQDFRDLVDQVHKMGMKIIIDLVVNHTSSEHPWFIESRSSVDAEKHDWYLWCANKGGLPNNWGSQFGGAAWSYNEKTDEYYLHLFSEKQPDLNWRNPNLRRAIYEMMNHWVAMGIDGFRMDVISLISKPAVLEDGICAADGYADWHSIVANHPKVHTYLKEMRKEVLNQKDMLTVGEASGVTLEEAQKYSSNDESELSMVFQFEHLGLDGSEEFKWTHKRIELKELKQVMAKWQQGLEGVGWNSLFWCNHDQPRIVSRMGDTGKYRERSAKMLATCLHFMKGTPYIFQGEELGMTNYDFTSSEQLRDIESINAYRKYTKDGWYSEGEMLQIISEKARDNARTPMQWSKEPNGGFTKGKPWMDVNPNFEFINAYDQMEREDSVYRYYQKLIEIRHQSDCVVYGAFLPGNMEHEKIYDYYRKWEEEELLIICNFSADEEHYDLSECYEKDSMILISNVTVSKLKSEHILQPWEAIVLQRKSCFPFPPGYAITRT